MGDSLTCRLLPGTGGGVLGEYRRGEYVRSGEAGRTSDFLINGAAELVESRLSLRLEPCFRFGRLLEGLIAGCMDMRRPLFPDGILSSSRWRKVCLTTGAGAHSSARVFSSSISRKVCLTSIGGGWLSTLRLRRQDRPGQNLCMQKIMMPTMMAEKTDTSAICVIVRLTSDGLVGGDVDAPACL